MTDETVYRLAQASGQDGQGGQSAGQAAGTGQAAAEGGQAAGQAADAGQASGMPQLDFSTFPNQIFWLIIAAVVLYMILSRVALPRIGGIIANRQETITNDIAEAEELKQKAKEAEQAYNKALADARAEANRIAEETKAEIQAEVDAEMEKADARIAEKTAESQRRIDEIRDSALENVEQVAKDTAETLVSRLGTQSDPSEAHKAVDARLKG